MRVLVTWDSTTGGAEGAGRVLSWGLRFHGFQVAARPLSESPDFSRYDAAIVGATLESGQWSREATEFLAQHASTLEKLPLWLFTAAPELGSGLLKLPAVRHLEDRAARLGAQDHLTIGEVPAGLWATAVDRGYAGNFLRPDEIRDWMEELVLVLPHARPQERAAARVSTVPRMLLPAVVGAALCATPAVAISSLSAAILLQGLVTLVAFGAMAWWYFRGDRAFGPTATATIWAATASAFNLGVAALNSNLLEVVTHPMTWLSTAAVFGLTWLSGRVLSVLPGLRMTASARAKHARLSKSEHAPLRLGSGASYS